jgi:hypothetical protein
MGFREIHVIRGGCGCVFHQRRRGFQRGFLGHLNREFLARGFGQINVIGR